MVQTVRRTVSYIIAHLMCRCKEIESEVEELKQQFCAEKLSKEGAPEDDHGTEDEKQQVKDEISDLQNRLDQEKRRSANLEVRCY